MTKFMFKVSSKYYDSLLSEFKKEKEIKIKIVKSQRELLLELASGKTLTEIAEKLNKTPNNIKKRTLNLYKKFNIHSRKELILKAIKQNIISCKNITRKCRKRFLTKSNNVCTINNIKQPKTFNLTEREYNFLLLLSKGYTRKQIMEELRITNMHACNYHYYCMLDKLNAKNAVQAIVTAIKYGILKI